MTGPRASSAGDSAAGCLVRIIGCAGAVALVVLGLLFLVAASARHAASRVAVGVLLLLVGVGLGLMAVRAHLGAREAGRPASSALPAIREPRCPDCGRSLEDQVVHMEGMAAVLRCPSCGGAFRLEEEPQW